MRAPTQDPRLAEQRDAYVDPRDHRVAQTQSRRGAIWSSQYPDCRITRPSTHRRHSARSTQSTVSRRADAGARPGPDSPCRVGSARWDHGRSAAKRSSRTAGRCNRRSAAPSPVRRATHPWVSRRQWPLGEPGRIAEPRPRRRRRGPVASHSPRPLTQYAGIPRISGLFARKSASGRASPADIQVDPAWR